MKNLTCIIILIILIILYNYSEDTKKFIRFLLQIRDWTLFVYPDANDIPTAGYVQYYTQGEFVFKSECQGMGLDISYNRKDYKNPIYQCGYRCNINNDYHLFLCKEIYPHF